MRFLKGLVLRGLGLEVEQVSTLGFAALLHQLPITNFFFFFRALGICLHFLLYLLPFAASYWGDSSFFSRTKATELGQASGSGLLFSQGHSEALLLCVQLWTFQVLGSGFLRKGDTDYFDISQTGMEPGPLLHCSGG